MDLGCELKLYLDIGLSADPLGENLEGPVINLNFDIPNGVFLLSVLWDRPLFDESLSLKECSHSLSIV